MSRETTIALIVAALVALGGYFAFSWQQEQAREERAEQRRAERETERQEALETISQLRRESGELMPDVLEGVELGMTVDELRQARPAARESEQGHDPGLMLFEERLGNGAQIMFGFHQGAGMLTQVQVLSLLPTLDAISPHLAAMHERYGTPTGVWDCPMTGNVPTRRFTWRRSVTTVSDVFLIHDDQVSLTLYIATSDVIGASLQRSHCTTVAPGDVGTFPVASPAAMQEATAEQAP